MSLMTDEIRNQIEARMRALESAEAEGDGTAIAVLTAEIEDLRDLAERSERDDLRRTPWDER
jgi:hypothetical protein